MDGSLVKTFGVIFLFVNSFRGSIALQCYHCSWSAEPDNCKRQAQEETTEKSLPYPVVKQCVPHDKRHTSSPPAKEDLDKHCKACPGPACSQCTEQNAACMKWSFIAGSAINITYMCASNPQSRKGCYEKEISERDKDKKYNRQPMKVQVCLCDTDYCSAAATRSLALLCSMLVVLVTRLSTMTSLL